MQAKSADVIVAPIFYSTERDREFDFSYPILEAGLQVLARGAGQSNSPTPLRDVLALLFSKSAAIWLAVGLIIILIPAHLLWLLDRGGEEGVSPSKNYFPGILRAMVWAATALVSQVQQLPGRWHARILGLFWMFAGVVFIALYTAQLTATLTEPVPGRHQRAWRSTGQACCHVRQQPRRRISSGDWGAGARSSRRPTKCMRPC